ncbi:MAG TPA: hypothetical protein VLL96_03125 [Candidatus Deferrimicrobiaceae bacterium]|nr:hypothetical protein [Candidatus Deferrimicrobiaceae bacterium]
MLLAPILGIALALLLAGAINSVMLPTQDDLNLQGFGAKYEKTPVPMPTHPPQAAASVTDGLIPPVLFIAGAVIVGVLAVMLFFREKGLAKTLSE